MPAHADAIIRESQLFMFHIPAITPVMSDPGRLGLSQP